VEKKPDQQLKSIERDCTKYEAYAKKEGWKERDENMEARTDDII